MRFHTLMRLYRIWYGTMLCIGGNKWDAEGGRLAYYILNIKASTKVELTDVVVGSHLRANMYGRPGLCDARDQLRHEDEDDHENRES